MDFRQNVRTFDFIPNRKKNGFGCSRIFDGIEDPDFWLISSEDEEEEPQEIFERKEVFSQPKNQMNMDQFVMKRPKKEDDALSLSDILTKKTKFSIKSFPFLPPVPKPYWKKSKPIVGVKPFTNEEASCSTSQPQVRTMRNF